MSLANLDPDVAASLHANNAPGSKAASTRIRMPVAERKAEAQLSRCKLLAEVITGASDGLTHSGSRIQPGVVDFGPSKAVNRPLDDVCNGLVAAYAGLGESLTNLGGSLAGDLLEPLQRVQQDIEEERARRRSGLLVLEQQEVNCMKSMEECASRRDKANEALQTLLHEQNQVQHGGWFFKTTLGGKLNRQVEQARHEQNKVVQELARCGDELTLARMRREEGADSIKELLVVADARLKEVLQPLLVRCANAMKETSQTVFCIAKKLEEDAVSLSRDEGHVFDQGIEASDSKPGVQVSGAETWPAPKIAGKGGVHESVVDRVCREVQAHKEPVPELHVKLQAVVKAREQLPAEAIGKPATHEPIRIDRGSRPDDGLSESGESSEDGDAAAFQKSYDAAFASKYAGSSTLASPSKSVKVAATAEAANVTPRGAKELHDEFIAGLEQDPLESNQHDANKLHEASGADVAAFDKADCLEFVAGESQGPLGLKLSWPPGRVLMQGVVPGGWAGVCGMQEGSEIITVNGELVAPMEEAQFRELLKVRPLCIAVLPAECSQKATTPRGTEAAVEATNAQVPIDRV